MSTVEKARNQALVFIFLSAISKLLCNPAQKIKVPLGCSWYNFIEDKQDIPSTVESALNFNKL